MEKIKHFLESDGGRDILTIIIIILVGLSSFGLGRLSKRSTNGLKIEYRGKEASVLGSINEYEQISPNSLNNTNLANPKNFFASSRGSKYYSLGCSGGKTIKEENKIFFTTKEEAEGAGYALSDSCK
ncbi:MAG: hypothetical protein AAB873_03120 [Patescibacteria group bacterium]